MKSKKKSTFADHIIEFNKRLCLGFELPEGIEVMNPFLNPEVEKLSTAFFTKFYSDQNKRHLIFGINPGRFGAGITGVSFTDPLNLEKYCGIKNDYQKKFELSSTFIYSMIEAFGGVEKFYGNFLLTALSPLGFTANGKNLNYYDHKALLKLVVPDVISWIRQQIDFGTHTEVCFCLGEGTNYKFFKKLNDEHQFFENIVPLPHPRYIMQYKRKYLSENIKSYVNELNKVT